MLKQKSGNISATTTSGNFSLPDVLLAIGNRYGQRIQDIDDECNEEIVEIQMMANRLITKVEEEVEAGKEVMGIRERMRRIHEIQADANESIYDVLIESIIKVSKEIENIGKRFRHDAIEKSKDMMPEDFADIIAEAFRAVQAKRERAE